MVRGTLRCPGQYRLGRRVVAVGGGTAGARETPTPVAVAVSPTVEAAPTVAPLVLVALEPPVAVEPVPTVGRASAGSEAGQLAAVQGLGVTASTDGAAPAPIAASGGPPPASASTAVSPAPTNPGPARTSRYARLGAYQAASPEYGMNIFVWGEPGTTQRDLGRLRELGFGWQKTLFAWREIEGQRKGQFDWREADRVVSASNAAGIKILARIGFAPHWARAQPAHNGPPNRYEDYAEFIYAFTMRNGSGSRIGRVHAIEVWNEPNLSREWGNAPINQAQAGDYVRLLQIAYRAAKSGVPQMTIVTAGLTPTGTRNNEEYWWLVTEPDGRPRPAFLYLLQARRSGELP
jgi:hypothetical protein